MNLSFNIKKSPVFIFDYLTDMQKFVTVHPVIFKIDKIGEYEYVVHEKLKLLFFYFSFSYPVSIQESKVNRMVIIKAIVFKFAKIEMRFRLNQMHDFTRVEECIKMVSPLPVKFIMKRIFKKQHAQLFRNIDLV